MKIHVLFRVQFHIIPAGRMFEEGFHLADIPPDLRQVFIPMTKSTIATVTLFFAISRWNGYFWAKQMVQNNWEWPLQVYIRNTLEALTNPDGAEEYLRYASESLIYSLIVCSIIPILVIYPFIQKYFAKGTNAGGVKE